MSANDQRLNLLVAYPYLNPQILERIEANADHIRFVLDSGAFTAWKAGKTITLNQYCDFLDKLPIKPWRYFALDVVGDPKATMSNYRAMLKRGYKPVPVFTRGEEIEVLEEYYETSDVVGIGGLVGTERNRGFVKGIMERVGRRRVHWLGFTNLNFIRVLKPYMADSSSWNMGGRYGAASVYLGGGRCRKLTRATCRADLQDASLRRAIEGFQIKPLSFLEEAEWRGGRSNIRHLGARSILAIQRDFLKRVGTYIFAAATTNIEVDLLLQAREIIYERKTA